jgi:hypothetical protein
MFRLWTVACVLLGVAAAASGTALANGPCLFGGTPDHLGICLLNEQTDSSGPAWVGPCWQAWSLVVAQPYVLAESTAGPASITAEQDHNRHAAGYDAACNADGTAPGDAYEESYRAHDSENTTRVAVLAGTSGVIASQQASSSSASDEAQAVGPGGERTTSSSTEEGAERATSVRAGTPLMGAEVRQENATESDHREASDESSSSSHDERTATRASDGSAEAAGVAVTAGQEQSSVESAHSSGSSSGAEAHGEKQTGVWVAAPGVDDFVGQDTTDGDCQMEAGQVDVSSCPVVLPDVHDVPTVPDLPPPPL